jgi:hypothetical protein
MACIPFQFTTNDNRYEVVSHGSGWAYEITDNATGKTLWFQDSDAVQVQNATEDFDNTDALLDYFECIDQ